jgi:Family of unknown function (DUF6262)
MPRGNPDNLRRAAQAKSEATTERAEHALRGMIKRGEAITFRGLAAAADVSLDFLYRSDRLRPRIEQLRAQQQRTPAARRTAPEQASAGDGSVIRTLSAQLTEAKRRHRDEVAALKAALAAAHGENLQLRRRLGIKASDTTPPVH